MLLQSDWLLWKVYIQFWHLTLLCFPKAVMNSAIESCLYSLWSLFLMRLIVMLDLADWNSYLGIKSSARLTSFPSQIFVLSLSHISKCVPYKPCSATQSLFAATIFVDKLDLDPDKISWGLDDTCLSDSTRSGVLLILYVGIHIRRNSISSHGAIIRHIFLHPNFSVPTKGRSVLQV